MYGMILTTCNLFSSRQQYQSAIKAFRRVKIRPIDTLIPFGVLLLLNIALLIAWTVVAPWKWERRPGRSFRKANGHVRKLRERQQNSFLYVWYPLGGHKHHPCFPCKLSKLSSSNTPNAVQRIKVYCSCHGEPVGSCSLDYQSLS